MNATQSKKQLDKVMEILSLASVVNWLRSQPHKIESLANEGHTMLDLTHWYLKNGSPKDALIIAQYAELMAR